MLKLKDDLYEVSVKSKSLTTSVTVAAPNLAAAERVAMQEFRRKVPGFSSLNICVEQIGLDNVWEKFDTFGEVTVR